MITNLLFCFDRFFEVDMICVIEYCVDYNCLQATDLRLVTHIWIDRQSHDLSDCLNCRIDLVMSVKRTVLKLPTVSVSGAGQGVRKMWVIQEFE